MEEEKIPQKEKKEALLEAKGKAVNRLPILQERNINKNSVSNNMPKPRRPRKPKFTANDYLDLALGVKMPTKKKQEIKKYLKRQFRTKKK